MPRHLTAPFSRNLLPEDNFCNGGRSAHAHDKFAPSSNQIQARLVVGGSESAPSASQTTDGGRVSNFKIMAVRRGFSSEGDLLLDYLEKGVFHALEKQYLKSFILALYLVCIAR
jgi:meiosis-specific protein HOP1